MYSTTIIIKCFLRVIQRIVIGIIIYKIFQISCDNIARLWDHVGSYVIHTAILSHEILKTLHDPYT